MHKLLKNHWLEALVILIFLGPFCFVRAENTLAPLNVQVYDNGTVVVKDLLQEVVQVHPIIFTGNFVEKHWEGAYPFQAVQPVELKPGFNALARVHGVLVDLLFQIQSSGKGLHFHYHMVPRESLEVSCVDVYASFSYSDWQGDPYEFNDNEGLVPVDRVADWAIRQADSAPLSLGPSHTHGGMTVQLTSQGLHLVMADNRYYSPELAMVYSHNDSKPNWIWEKEESKDFDFTITFNRPFGRSPEDHGITNASPSRTPTVTPTPLENDCLDRLIDDFEDPARNGSSPIRINHWGGKWNTASSSDTNISVSFGHPGAEGTRYCASVSGSNPLDSKGGDAVFQTFLFDNGSPFNTVIHGLTGVQFWMKGDGNSYWFNILSSAVTDINGYSFNVVPPKGVWTLFKVPFSEMSLKSWWETEGGAATHPDGSNVTGVGFESKGRGSFSFEVDQIAFFGNPSNCPDPMVPEEPTLIPTPSSTPQPTPTFTATATYSACFTSTPTPTATPRQWLFNAYISSPSPIPTYPPTRTPPPTPSISPVQRPPRIRMTPTPLLSWKPKKTSLVHPWPAKISPVQNLIPTPTQIVSHLLSLLDKEVIIEFAAPPANIYVTFGDGSGWYELQIIDQGANLVKTIYHKHVIAETDAWVEWDGRNEKGEDMPPGQYFVVIYKDSKALKSISVIRSPKSN